MAVDQADLASRDNADRPVDRVQEDSQKSLSQSLWDEFKGVVSQGLKAGEEGGLRVKNPDELDFGTGKDLYGDQGKNVLDFNPAKAYDGDKVVATPEPKAYDGSKAVAMPEPKVYENPGEKPVAMPEPAEAPKAGDPPIPGDIDPGFNPAGIIDRIGDSIKNINLDNLVASINHSGDIDPKDYKNDGTFRVPGDATTSKNFYEIIKVDAEPAEHTVKKNETLTSIAREHLGKDASAADVHKHAMEIARVNGIKNPNIIHAGQELKLPGHTKNGGIVENDKEGSKVTHWPDGTIQVDKKNDTGYRSDLGADGKRTEYHYGPNPEDMYTLRPQADGSYQGEDMAGNKHTRWDDGKEKVEYKDGRGYTRTPDTTNGGYDEHHWGPRPEDNFELKKTADGKTEVREKTGDRPAEARDSADVKAERDKLTEHAEKKITDPEELAKFKADMARFEERSKSMEELYKKQGMTPEQAKEKANKEVAETYKNVDRLLEANDNPAIPLDGRKRIQLAEQVMDHAATPTSVDQGLHPTCNVATVETRAYTQNPSEAAKLVADVATTGEYKTKDGKTIKIDAGSLEPHDQAKNHPAKDGERDHASQIFQVTAVNVYYQRNGSIRYEQREPDPTLTPPDNGERRFDYSKTPPELAKEEGKEYHNDFNPGLSDEQIAEADKQITGQGDGKDWYIRHGDGKSDKVAEIDSPEKLEQKIKEAKEQGKLPVVIKVHSGNEPFLTDSGGGTAGGSGGWHVVTVTDYQAGPPAKVAIDNQWGSKVDHGKGSEVTITDLYKTMRDPGDDNQISELRKEVEKNRTDGKIDRYKELELLRLEHNDKKLSDADYKTKVEEQIKKINEEWKAKETAGTLVKDAEYYKLRDKARDLVHNMPSDQRMDILHQQKTMGFYDDAYYKEVLGWEMADIKKQQKKDVDDGKYDDDKKKKFDKTAEEFKKILDEYPTEADREKIKQNIEKYSK